MRLNKETINTEPKFEKQELMRLFMCLALLQNGEEDEDKLKLNFELYQTAIFYLGSKIGAEMDEEDKQAAKEFYTKIIKFKEQENV